MTADPVSFPPTGGSVQAVSPPVWSGGSEYVAVANGVTSSSATSVPVWLATVAADGSLTPQASMTQSNFCRLWFDSSGYSYVPLRLVQSSDQLYVACPTGSYVAQGGALVPAPPAGVWEDGGLKLTSDGEGTFDGSPRRSAGGAVVPVDGNSSLVFVGADLMVGGSATVDLTGWTLPAAPTRAVQTPAGILALVNGTLYLSSGAPGPMASAAQPSSEEFSMQMLDAVNRYRVLLGQRPAVDDALIAQAALNHARYWNLNPAPPASDTLSYHNETTGYPGFTGIDPSQRCSAVGATCNGEDESCCSDAQQAVDGWMNSVYHRPLIIDPWLIAAGGGANGNGVTFLDGEEVGKGFLLDHIAYPQGNYAGSLAFYGNEAPDPLTHCPGLSAPTGAIISDYPPSFTTISGVTLTSNGVSLSGCLTDDSFIPAHPLKPYTTYTVTVSGTWGTPYSWSFTTGSGDSASSSGGDSTSNGPSDTGGGASTGSGRLRSPRLHYSTLHRHGRRISITVRVLAGRGTFSAVAQRGASKRALRLQVRGGLGRLQAILAKGRWRLTVIFRGRPGWRSVTRQFAFRV